MEVKPFTKAEIQAFRAETSGTGDELCGIVTFSISGVPAAEVKTKLGTKNINVHVGLAQSTLYYMNRKGLEGVVRASVHYYNTKKEIEKICHELGTKFS